MHKKPWSLQPGGFLCKKNSSTPPVMKWASATWQRRHVGHAFSILFLFLLRSTAAQTFNSTPPPPPNFNPYALKPQFNPGMAAIVIALISAFFVMAFFSIYIRNRRDRLENQRLPTVGAARPPGGGAARGLDPAVVESFPKFVYSEVKKHKIGKGALECAVCLSEFEDDDNLRLLPKCDHVFHPDCIDSWFAAHTTCPVCRTNFSPETGSAAVAAEPPPEVAITVNDGGETPEAEEELPPLPPGRQRRRIPRSHSTGHSVQLSEDRERYTLRLPEMIRRDVVAGRFKRSASCYAAGEGSAAKGRSVGEMIGGGRSSFKMRTWDRWASFKRSFSVKMPRGEDAGTSAAAAAAVGRSLSKTKEGRKAEDGSVNAPIPVGADR